MNPTKKQKITPKFLLASSTYPIYVAEDSDTQKCYALKIFNYENDGMSLSYLNERRFA
jgi:hypothetical protein